MTGSYQLLDCGAFEKMEQLGPFTIIRPAPQAVWKKSYDWNQKNKIDAYFERLSGGQGQWHIYNPKINQGWQISLAHINLNLQLTDFGHLGVFAEQKASAQKIAGILAEALRRHEAIHVLNLFAYTGFMSLVCARAGAHVTHVDASKTSVSWARDNAHVNHLEKAPIRWIVDDVKKFVSREIKRGRKYDAIILDPPSFGRGTRSEIWKIEEDLVGLMEQLKCLLNTHYKFILLSCHTNAYTGTSLKNIVKQIVGADHKFDYGEMLIKNKQGLDLPSGHYCLACRL